VQMKAGANLYQGEPAGAGAAGGAPGSGATGGDGGNNDDVIDAEVVEEKK